MVENLREKALKAYKAIFGNQECMQPEEDGGLHQEYPRRDLRNDQEGRRIVSAMGSTPTASSFRGTSLSRISP